MTPVVSVDQMREVDRIMIEELHIELIQMMENAGRCLASHVRTELGGDVRGKRVVVLAGRGGNGGGGLASARRLSIWSADVRVVLGARPGEFSGAPGVQLDILGRIGVPVSTWEESGPTDLAAADILVDALIGYSLKGSPGGAIAELISGANTSGRPIAALDLPSGLSGDLGPVVAPIIRAASTLTLALPKVGLLKPESAPYVGRLYLADISVPRLVYERIGVQGVGDLFIASDIVPVTTG